MHIDNYVHNEYTLKYTLKFVSCVECLPTTLARRCTYVKYRFSNTCNAFINFTYLLRCVEYSPATLAMQRIGEEETLKVSSISPGLLASMTDTWVWEPEL